MTWWKGLDPEERAREIRTWLPKMRDDFEERAAILEANGLKRAEAERQAFEMVVEAHYQDAPRPVPPGAALGRAWTGLRSGSE